MTNSKPTKRALGRGLDAILSSPDTDITSTDISGNYVAGAIAELNINEIEANPFQPRSDFDELMLKELADSIKSQGVVQPITVRKMGRDHYQLIAGERRLKASKLAGLKRIPSFIRVANDEQMLELALIENIHRADLNAIEVAISYQRLIEECDLTQEKLSERVGKSRSAIANFLRLLKLPPEIQVALRDSSISMGHARALITVEDESTQLHILKSIIADGLSVRQIEEVVRKLNNPDAKKKNASEKSISEKYKDVPAVISKVLGTQIKIRRSETGQGNIVIAFKNDAELDKIISFFEKK